MFQKRDVPSWKANVAVFLCLFFLMVIMFLIQVEQTRRAFLEDAKSHAMLLAGVVKLHVQNAIESQEITDEIARGHLKNIASFVDYLDSLGPFSPQELEAFSRKTGLYGIAIMQPEEQVVTGVKDWEKSPPDRCGPRNWFRRDHNAHLLVFALKRKNQEGCIVCAMPSQDFERLQSEIGLESVMHALKRVRGVLSIELKGADKRKTNPGKGLKLEGVSPNKPRIQLITAARPPFVSISIPLKGSVKGSVLDVRLDASNYQNSLKRLWRSLFLISLSILISGSILSFWLYRKHKEEMKRAVQLEKEMSRQREDAMIGRAAATIAHEVRNPLNAVQMGLQRLKMESRYLDEEQRRIVDLSLGSIKRANGIISNLLEFSRKIFVKRKEINLKGLVEEVLPLYDLERNGIELELSPSKDPIMVQADPDLMRHVIHNLVKNALDAQDKGGFLSVIIKDRGEFVEVAFQNGGTIPKEGEIKQILEPYFTTKTQGTGIGLAFSKRIIKAHGGTMEVQVKGESVFEVRFSIPKRHPGAKEVQG